MRPRAALIGLALAAAAALPASATPATYPVLACGPAAGGANLSWTLSNTTPDTLAGSQSCPAPGSLDGLLVTDIPNGALTPPGARAEWTFTAPPGLPIAAISGQRWLLTQLDDDWVAYIRDAAGRHLEECRTGPGLAICQSAGALYPPEPVPFRHEGLATGSVSIGIACTGIGCGNGLGDHWAGASLQDVRVDLEDSSPARVTGQSGPFIDAGGGWLRGAQVLTVAGADTGGGLAALGLALTQGPTTRIGDYRRLPCDYRQKIPCSPAGALDLSLDTTQLPDGAHVAHAFADDATLATSLANRSLGPAFLVRTDNTRPPAPALNAPAALASASIAATATLGAQEPGAPIAHVDWSLAPADGGPGQSAGRGAPGALSGLVAPRPGAWTLTASATDLAGNIGPVASLVLAVAPAPVKPGLAAPMDDGGFPGLRLRLAERARPVAGRRVRELRPRLSWPAVGGARGYQVHLLWVRPDGTLRRVAQERVRAARYRPPVGPLRSGRRYLWRVWPLRADGRPGELHAASVFDVGLGFARPRAGTVTTRLRPVLRWRAPAGVRRHEIRLYRVHAGGRGLRPIARARVAGTRYRVAPSTLRSGGRYLWLVRPARARGPLVASSFFRVAPEATRPS